MLINWINSALWCDDVKVLRLLRNTNESVCWRVHEWGNRSLVSENHYQCQSLITTWWKPQSKFAGKISRERNKNNFPKLHIKFFLWRWWWKEEKNFSFIHYICVLQQQKCRKLCFAVNDETKEKLFFYSGRNKKLFYWALRIFSFPR